jgi:hypothetical protein
MDVNQKKYGEPKIIIVLVHGKFVGTTVPDDSLYILPTIIVTLTIGFNSFDCFVKRLIRNKIRFPTMTDFTSISILGFYW